MEKEDHLDKETGFDVAISEAGLNVRAKSRIVSTIDRWGGNFFRKKSFKGERAVQTDEQIISLEAKIVQKAGEKLLKRVDEDDDFALEVLNIAYSREARRRDNKEGVILAALEILRNDPAGDNESLEGPEVLSDNFLDRVERYAEDASTDELQQRWGRILAGEIRKPGMFNRKVLRAVDELEPEVAALFEDISKFCVQGAMFRSIARELSYNERVDLLTAGLITTVDENEVRYFTEMPLKDGTLVWFMPLGSFAIAYPKDTAVDYANSKILSMDDNKPYLPTNLLSDVGNALLSIIPRDEKLIARNIANVVSSQLSASTLMHYKMDAQSNHWVNIPAI